MGRMKKQPSPSVQSLVYRTYDAVQNPRIPQMKSSPGSKRHGIRLVITGIILLAIAGYGLFAAQHFFTGANAQKKGNSVATKINYCQSNRLSQLALVSISKRHMWACEGPREVYDSPVITGMEQYAADETPTGTYHVAQKLTDQDLRGCDTTGCWDDHVKYWLPFLTNQYGDYGFHDATWRPNSAFGSISPKSKNASHGCVELPLAVAQWLYDWTQIGLTVKIES